MKLFLAVVTGIILQIMALFLCDATSGEGFITYLIGYFGTYIGLKD